MPRDINPRDVPDAILRKKLNMNLEYNLDVLRGKVPGHTMIAINGHDQALDNTRTTIAPSLTTSNIDQSAIFATPAVVGVASTDNTADAAAGTGALTVRVFGLDASGDAQTNDVTLTGQTAANTADTFSAINGFRVLTTGSSNSNTGTLWIGTGTFTAGVPAVKLFSMDPLSNKGLTAYYVVPNGKTLYLRQFIMTVATANKDVDFYIEQSSDGSFWYTEGVFGMESGEFTTNVITIPGLAAGTHVRIEAVSSSPGGVDVTSILGCELVDN